RRRHIMTTPRATGEPQRVIRVHWPYQWKVSRLHWTVKWSRQTVRANKKRTKGASHLFEEGASHLFEKSASHLGRESQELLHVDVVDIDRGGVVFRHEITAKSAGRWLDPHRV